MSRGGERRNQHDPEQRLHCQILNLESTTRPVERGRHLLSDTSTTDIARYEVDNNSTQRMTAFKVVNADILHTIFTFFFSTYEGLNCGVNF